jgi:hypothetical protein
MASPDDTTFRVLDWAFMALGGLMSVIWAMLGVRIKKTEDAGEKIQAQHQQLELRIASEYVPRRDLDKSIDAIFRKLDTIEQLLHQKADK